MSENKKQHYVPRHYLKGFSQDGKSLNRYDLEAKESSQKGIENLCQESYFYGKEPEIEKALQEIENKQAPVLCKLIDTQNIEMLKPDEFGYLLLFILLQYTRTKYAKKMANKFTDEIVSDVLKPMMKSSEELKSKGITEEIINGLKITDPSDYMRGMLTALTGRELISDLKPFLIINKSNRHFICSDAPIALYNSIKYLPMPALVSPGLQIFCPLNKDTMLLLIDTNLYNLKINTDSTIYLDNDSDVDSINKLQFFHCLHHVFFSDKTIENYVRDLHLEIEHLIKEREVVTKTIQTIRNKDGSYSEIEEIYTKGSNYRLKLTFIKLNHANNRLLKGKYKKLSRTSKPFNLCRNDEIVERNNVNCKNILESFKRDHNLP
ncbi:MAG: DUF4238 domain-containing protein [Candidatus Methanoperedens sp.]